MTSSENNDYLKNEPKMVTGSIIRRGRKTDHRLRNERLRGPSGPPFHPLQELLLQPDEGRFREVSAWALPDNNTNTDCTYEGESHPFYFSIYTNGITNPSGSSLILLPSLLRWVRSFNWLAHYRYLSNLSNSMASLIAHLVKEIPVLNSWAGKIRRRRDRLPTPVFLGFSCGSAGKESTCNVGDLGSNPGMGRSPGEGKVFWPGEFHRR